MMQINPITALTPSFTDVQYPNNPFHIGEITLQQMEHMQDHVMSYAPQFIRSHYMPDQHRLFYNDLPFLVVAIRDPHTGYMWSSLLENIHPRVEDDMTTTTTTTSSNKGGMVATSPDPNTLFIHARPVVGDALEHVFDDESTSSMTSSPSTTTIDVGILGIQFETARRNRVNGRITIHQNDTGNHSTKNEKQTPQEQEQPPPLIFKVDQSFGNCPQYIKPRKQWYRAEVPTLTTTTTTDSAVTTTTTDGTSSNTKMTHRLSPRQMEWIETAETFFTATGYRNFNDLHHNTNVRYGNDASHRGGPPGFVQVIVGTTDETEQEPQHQEIVWTEFSGNNHFNSLGNLMVDARIGLCFPNFTDGGMLQITGTATVQMGNLQQGQRQVRMSILAINEVPPRSLPIRWPSDQTKKPSRDSGVIDQNKGESEADDENSSASLQVMKIVQESENVKSFYFQRPQPPSTKEALYTNSKISVPSLPTFRAGEHLPIQLKRGSCGVVDRRYSISSSPMAHDYYRISVKRHAHGKASTYLHDHIKVGDLIKAGSPGGGFTLENRASPSPPKSIVLISAGIGITPLLSMLHELASLEPQKEQQQTKIYWIHGARNGKEHPFQDEMKELQETFASKHPPNTLQVHTLYSAPETNDTCDIVGRVTVPYVQNVVPNLAADDDHTTVYMCGPLSFLADMETGLMDIGIDGKNIHYETF